MPSAAFHVAEKKAAIGPVVSIQARCDRSPSRCRLAIQSAGPLPSAMLVGTPPLYLTTGISCLLPARRPACSAGEMNGG